jgi:hypothetical protein
MARKQSEDSFSEQGICAPFGSSRLSLRFSQHLSRNEGWTEVSYSKISVSKSANAYDMR